MKLLLAFVALFSSLAVIKAQYFNPYQPPLGNRGDFDTYYSNNVYLNKVIQAVATAQISSNQRNDAEAIIKAAEQNFKRCEEKYVAYTMVQPYRACMGSSIRLAMSQIRNLEVVNRMVPHINAILPVYSVGDSSESYY